MAVVRPIVRAIVRPIVNPVDSRYFSWAAYWAARYPSGLLLTIISDTGIDLTWKNNGAEDYDRGIIERSDDGGVTWIEVGMFVTGDTSYSDTGLTGSTEYDYRIRYERSGYYSDYSNSDSDITNVNSAYISGYKFEVPDINYFQNTFADFGTLGIQNLYSSIYYNGYTYISYAGVGTDAYITTYRHSTGVWAAPVKIGNNPLIDTDGHGAPAMLVDASGYIHVIFGAHITTFQYFKSNSAEDISAWTNMGNPAPTTTCTYPSLMQMSGGTIFLFYRNKSGDAANRQWGYVTSGDGGTSWSGYTIVVQNDFAYCIFKKGVGNTIHCTVTKGDSYLDRQNIYYIKMVTYPNWVNINGDAQTLPIELPATGILAYDSGVEWIPTPVYEIDGSNNPYILFTEGHGSNHTDDLGTYAYKFLKHNGVSWITYDIGATVTNWRNFATAIDVISASIIDIYIVRNGVDGERGGDIEKWSTIDGGITWSKISKIIKGTFLDPLIVKDYNANAKLLLTEYRGSSSQWIGRAYLWGDSGFIKNPAIIATSDITGKYDGTPLNNPSIVDGVYGKCFSFVAATVHSIRVPDNDVFSFDSGKPYSATMWVKCTGTAANQTLIAKRYAADNEWQMIIYNDKLYNQLINDVNSITATAPFTTTDTFVFLCFTNDGSNSETGLKIFINLTESQTVQTEAGTFIGGYNSVAPVCIGGVPGTVYYLNGLLDEVKIWNKVLSGDEMALVMNNDPNW